MMAEAKPKSPNVLELRKVTKRFVTPDGKSFEASAT